MYRAAKRERCNVHRCMALLVVSVICMLLSRPNLTASAATAYEGRLRKLDAGIYCGLSLSELCERFALRIEWDPEHEEVTVKYGAKQVLFKEGDSTALAGANSFSLSAPIVRYGHDLLIPADGALRLLGYLRGREYSMRETDSEFIVYHGEETSNTADRTAPPAAQQPQRQPAAGRTIELVVIDPGHGGWDTGVVGSSGLKEKELTLSAAKELAEMLRSRLGLKVVLTRNADYYLSLDDRIEIANTSKDGMPADLYIGLHVNASFSPLASGPRCISLPYYTEHDGRSGVIEVADGVNVPPLRRLSDRWAASSYRLGELISDALRWLGKHNTYQLTEGHGYILRRIDMPAVVIELGFLSNGVDTLELCQKESLRRLCSGIYSGIEKYIQENVTGVTTAGD